ncbi:DUF2510 domain-containing protein [Iamia majanohamensis]|uniref:DUF2510 domain-containing protein n=1 Tax=Iamia majanohamensis TaxID=467976 RepID=A0AAF0BSR5_9ACTN|nr:DUF2510 domain-containing protein [Iamia majanohamensis]WCO65662.1 DUF2510 domain-containing protein [Iamia majanohamensis]
MSDGQQPAGWYPSGVPGEQRYWDGAQWTEHTAPVATPGPPPSTLPPPPGGGGGRSMAYVLIPVGVCVVLAVVLVVVGLVASGGDDDEASPSPTTEEGGPDTTEDEDDGPTGPGSADEPLPIGQTATIGDYEVRVTSVDLDATDEVLAANEFNDDPTNGTYALVEVEATYTGDEEGTPASDLTATLQGGDGVQYEQFECSAVTPGGVDFTTLTEGGSASFDLCWDYPSDAADGATMFVEDFLTVDGEDARSYWEVG